MKDNMLWELDEGYLEEWYDNEHEWGAYTALPKAERDKLFEHARIWIEHQLREVINKLGDNDPIGRCRDYCASPRGAHMHFYETHYTRRGDHDTRDDIRASERQVAEHKLDRRIQDKIRRHKIKTGGAK